MRIRFQYTLMILAIFVVVLMPALSNVFAGEISITTEEHLRSVFIDGANTALKATAKFLGGILFYPIFGIPFLVLWLMTGGIFFTIRLGFVNIRLFTHALKVVRGKYSSPDDPGEVSHFQALAAAVSATVGLGNIGGVAIAVSIGGPGAVIWMAIAGFFGMSMKFAEVTMGQKYRELNKEGRISGGAFHYLRKGLAEKGLPRTGKILAIIFAFACMGGALGGGNMYQSQQSVSILRHTFSSLNELDWIIALVLAVSVGIVLLGGIRRIARVAESVVPLMAFIYLSGALVVLVANIDSLGAAFSIMFNEAFSGSAAGGGIIGAIIAGAKRASFSNEAGLGSAPIAHAAARTTEPVREGCVALLEPFIDTIVICFVTGLLITVTGVYNDTSIGNGSGMQGVLLTSAAFETVIDWFPIVLSVAVVLFAYSTMITWSYYGGKAWEYLFGIKNIWIFYIIFCFATFFGGVSDLSNVIAFSDLLLLSMALPNLIGLYILSNDLRKDVNIYIKKLRRGDFRPH